MRAGLRLAPVFLGALARRRATTLLSWPAITLGVAGGVAFLARGALDRLDLLQRRQPRHRDRRLRLRQRGAGLAGRRGHRFGRSLGLGLVEAGELPARQVAPGLPGNDPVRHSHHRHCRG